MTSSESLCCLYVVMCGGAGGPLAQMRSVNIVIGFGGGIVANLLLASFSIVCVSKTNGTRGMTKIQLTSTALSSRLSCVSLIESPMDIAVISCFLAMRWAGDMEESISYVHM